MKETKIINETASAIVIQFHLYWTELNNQGGFHQRKSTSGRKLLQQQQCALLVSIDITFFFYYLFLSFFFYLVKSTTNCSDGNLRHSHLFAFYYLGRLIHFESIIHNFTSLRNFVFCLSKTHYNVYTSLTLRNE